MAGTRGPIAGRSEDTIRRNIGDPITKIDIKGPVEVPELGIKNPHPIVADLYESMRDSGQAQYYEPSDWQYARLTMHLLNDMIKPKRVKGKDGRYRQSQVSAMMVTSINQMLTSLLLTEGDRRRVRIEVERNQGGGEATVTPISDVYRDLLTQAQTNTGGAAARLSDSASG